jgi:hypothetical protein
MRTQRTKIFLVLLVWTQLRQDSFYPSRWWLLYWFFWEFQSVIAQHLYSLRAAS